MNRTLGILIAVLLWGCESPAPSTPVQSQAVQGKSLFSVWSDPIDGVRIDLTNDDNGFRTFSNPVQGTYQACDQSHVRIDGVNICDHFATIQVSGGCIQNFQTLGTEEDGEIQVLNPGTSDSCNSNNQCFMAIRSACTPIIPVGTYHYKKSDTLQIYSDTQSYLFE